jgi:hypothetical protein
VPETKSNTVTREALKGKDINDLNLAPLLFWDPGGGHEELGSSDLVEAIRGRVVVGHLALATVRSLLPSF